MKPTPKKPMPPKKRPAIKPAPIGSLRREMRTPAQSQRARGAQALAAWSDNPREIRALMALLDGPKSREAMDRIVGCSNAPELVSNLRNGLGLDIPCERVDLTDRDGRNCRPGIYSLTGADRAKVLRPSTRQPAPTRPKAAIPPKPTPRKRASGPQSERKGRK